MIDVISKINMLTDAILYSMAMQINEYLIKTVLLHINNGKKEIY